MTNGSRILIFGGVLSLFSLHSFAGTIVPGPVVPNALTAVEGNSSNIIPFQSPDDRSTPMWSQQVYQASEFGGPISIVRIAFRPNGDFGAAFSMTIPDVRIDLSTTSVTPDTLSSTFANNLGADD